MSWPRLPGVESLGLCGVGVVEASSHLSWFSLTGFLWSASGELFPGRLKLVATFVRCPNLGNISVVSNKFLIYNMNLPRYGFL